MKRLFVRTLLAGVALAACGLASAQGSKTIKFATQNPTGHPIVAGMEKFKEIVEAKSGGRLKVKLFPGGTLGSDQANVSALQAGTLEMASMNSGILANQVKEFAVWDFPFLFANVKEADAITDGPFGQKMHDKLEAKGLVGLAYYELGFRNISNSKRPITRANDLAGLKLRVIPNPINVDWVKALGANPVPLPFPEVYGAMEQGAIDGQENPISVINFNKFYEVQKYLVLSRHQYNPQSVLVSKKFWDSLSADQKKILTHAARESAKYQREFNRSQDAGALANLRQGGMQVTEFPAAELARLRDKLRPVTAKYAVTVGQETVQELQAELGKVRQ